MCCAFLQVARCKLVNQFRPFLFLGHGLSTQERKPLSRQISSFIKTEAEENNPETKVGVYIHWPYCARLCTYCNFNKYVIQKVDQENMEKSLLKEWKTLRKKYPRLKIRTIFFGGGTPSLMKPDIVESLIREISGGNYENLEVSLEANPADVNNNVADFKLAGVTRLSLGIQSFNDRFLKLFNRDHNSLIAKQSLGKCLSVFGGHVSADLIFGAPGQTIQEWRQDLEFTIKQGVNHISTYQLTVEKGTQLAKDVSSGKVQLPSDNVMTEMYLDAVQHLEKNGLYRYEISNFGRPGFECNHNIGYWNGGQYIGLGPGAHSRIGCGANRIGTINHPSPEVWKGQVDRLGHGVAKETKLDIDTVLGELLATGLRTSQGIEASVWNKSSQNKIIFHQIIKYLNNINSRNQHSTEGLNVNSDVSDTLGTGDLCGLIWNNKNIKILPSHLSIADHVIVNVYSHFLKCFKIINN